MATSSKTTERSGNDESIGRPEPWREGRYEENDDAPQESVLKDPGEGEEPPDTRSTPVTEKDYTGG